jgi:hypothetical protein
VYQTNMKFLEHTIIQSNGYKIFKVSYSKNDNNQAGNWGCYSINHLNGSVKDSEIISYEHANHSLERI